MNVPLPKAEEVLLQLLRQETQQPSLTLDEAMAQPLFKSLLAMVSAGQVGGAQDATAEPLLDDRQHLRSLAGSEAVIAAAIEDTFDLTALAPDSAERAALLAASDVVTVGSLRRLRLTDASRAEVLAAAAGSDSYHERLSRALSEDSAHWHKIVTDPAALRSAWLRRFLAGAPSSLDAPPQELAAALAARQRLRLVTDLASSVPSVAEVARRVGLAELLEPLRLLIGAEGSWYRQPKRDRFVGRKRELRQLRSFVDELSSRSAGELLSRAAAKVVHTVTGSAQPRLIVVEGGGGLGKSALLAKFVLDHALDQSRHFPFAYLDFDRASIDAERPLQLLIEIGRQVGLQFPAAQPELGQLAADIRADLVRPSDDSRAAAPAGIRDPFARFVEILREHATFGRRAFLLVFDTLEVVQWNRGAMDRLDRLVQELDLKGLDELRVVASGRADVPELHRSQRAPVQHIKLEPLSVSDARSMAEALGRGAIGNDWESSWSDAIAGSATLNIPWLPSAFEPKLATREEVRREPLAIRVAVDLILRTDPPSRRQAMAEEIARTGVDGNEDFVAGLYEKRIIGHVRDGRAKRLAWPGLVIRRVTPEIVRELLAPFCGIPSGGAEAAFNALGQEIWMVERDGEALRHRPDLRARTLSLMRSKDAKTFDDIARAAVEYFARHRRRSREDHAEWLYHRLLLGEAPENLAGEVSADDLSLLARTEADFPPGSPAASYIAARTANSRLSPQRLRQLRPDDALYHLSTTATDMFALDDLALDADALELSTRVADAFTALDSERHPWAHALWVKTGDWERIPAAPKLGDALPRTLLGAYLFWAARVIRTLPASQRGPLLAECMRALASRSSHPREESGFRTLVQGMALARIGKLAKDYASFDDQTALVLSTTRPTPSPSLQAALRTAIVFGNASRRPALKYWLLSRRKGSGSGGRVWLAATSSLAELRALSRLHPDGVDLLPASEPDKTPKRIFDEPTSAQARRLLEQSLGDLEATPDRIGGSTLAHFFACREEDWIVPLGYAAARAAGSQVSAAAARRLASYTNASTKTQATIRDIEPPNDMLAAMRFADEASDLAGFARLVLDECEPRSPATAQLRSLLAARDDWAHWVAKNLATPESPRARRARTSYADQAPEAGPIVHRDDPQKNRWGGQPRRAGRAVRAVLESVERSIFYFSVIVESTDGSVLRPPVKFHLHDSYPRSVVSIRRIVDGRRAELNEWSAEGVSTVGVQVKDRNGDWVSLELDLASLPGLPKRFH